MKHNVGRTDKIIRYIVGIIFLVLGYEVHWGFYIPAVGAILTALFGYCGLYSILKIKT